MEYYMIKELKLASIERTMGSTDTGKYMEQIIELRGVESYEVPYRKSVIEVTIKQTGTQPALFLNGLDPNSLQKINIEKYDPTELTPDHLINFGFVQDGNWFTLETDKIKLRIQDCYYHATCEDFRVGFIFTWGEFRFQKEDRYLKTVADLESLYYGLTGEVLRQIVNPIAEGNGHTD